MIAAVDGFLLFCFTKQLFSFTKQISSLFKHCHNKASEQNWANIKVWQSKDNVNLLPVIRSALQGNLTFSAAQFQNPEFVNK
jgi:hypothetical protein